MSLIYTDSFDNYATADVIQRWPGQFLNSGSQSIGAFGRNASNGMRFALGGGGFSGNCELTKIFTTSGDTCIFGMAIRLSTIQSIGSTRFHFISVRSIATGLLYLRQLSSGVLQVLQGNNSTVFGNTTPIFVPNVYIYLEVKMVIHPSAGTVEVRANGLPVFTGTGLNTANGGPNTWNSIRIGLLDQGFDAYTGTNIDIDDFYAFDGTGAAPWNNFLGDVRVDARFPTAAGATTGWTPSAGSNFQTVDEVAPNGDTDYNSAAAPGVTDTFIFQDVPVVGAVVYGIQHCISSRKTDAGAATIVPVVRHSSVDNLGASINPATNYAIVTQVSQVNPGTAAQWTETDFNAAEFGYRRTA